MAAPRSLARSPKPLPQQTPFIRAGLCTATSDVYLFHTRRPLACSARSLCPRLLNTTTTDLYHSRPAHRCTIVHGMPCFHLSHPCSLQSKPCSMTLALSRSGNNLSHAAPWSPEIAHCFNFTTSSSLGALSIFGSRPKQFRSYTCPSPSSDPHPGLPWSALVPSPDRHCLESLFIHWPIGYDLVPIVLDRAPI